MIAGVDSVAQIIVAGALATALLIVVVVIVRGGVRRGAFKIGPFTGEVEARDRIEKKVDDLVDQVGSVYQAVNNVPPGEGSLSEQVSSIKRAQAWQLDSTEWLLQVVRQLNSRVGGGQLPPGPGPRPRP